MATVLLCQDERLGRPVAVKRLHADSPVDVERRFLREARLGASLNHPGLVSVYDTETDDEGLLIVMEYVEGESLGEALQRGPLPQRRVVEIARELGEALDHVHDHGVVHRDVKPANVLLRRDGAVKLADLGIAVSVDQTRVTRSGTVLGSAAYMAPEQLESGDVGPAADVYALATVCFEALAGRKARRGRTPVEIAHSVATTPPPDVREHAPDLPAAAAEALTRGMARHPAERTGSAGELAAELASGLEQGASEKRRAPEATAATRKIGSAPPAVSAPAADSRAGQFSPITRASARRRSPAGPLAVLLIALAAAAVVGAVVLAGGGDDSPTREPSKQGQAAPRQREQAPADTDAAQTDTGGDQADGQADDGTGGQAETPPAASGTSIDPAGGAALNEQGYALMRRGDFGGAVPILQKAVASWPEDSTDLNYAYALYNLGVSLNRSGHPDEAIPYLEKRLNWSNQRGIVKKELKLAQQNAGG
jgi:serine/threonine-protein kinase